MSEIFEIFTDASVFAEGMTSCIAVYLSSAPKYSIRKTFINGNIESEEAEVLAIEEALIYIKSNKSQLQNRKILIYNDNEQAVGRVLGSF